VFSLWFGAEAKAVLNGLETRGRGEQIGYRHSQAATARSPRFTSPFTSKTGRLQEALNGRRTTKWHQSQTSPARSPASKMGTRGTGRRDTAPKPITCFSEARQLLTEVQHMLADMRRELLGGGRQRP
jgi:hypothetical protein